MLDKSVGEYIKASNIINPPKSRVSKNEIKKGISILDSAINSGVSIVKESTKKFLSVISKHVSIKRQQSTFNIFNRNKIGVGGSLYG